MSERDAVLYLRISKDSEGLGLGVARQREDALTLAQARGYNVVAVHEDNDISAAGGKHRPGFEAVLEDLAEGRARVVVAWALDRLTRNRRDSVRLFEAAQEAQAVISLCRGSDLDMSTPAGRMTADILASVARAEIETKSDRQQRAMLQRAEQGRRWWSNRPFGYNRDGTPHETEADLVREGFQHLLEGGTVHALMRQWNEAGVLTTMGKSWHAPQVRTVFVVARNAGLRTYRGEVVGRGNWTPLVSEDLWRAVATILLDPSRSHGGSRVSKYLLTGIAECGICDDGTTVEVSHSRSRVVYRCRAKSHAARGQADVDQYVVQNTLALLIRPEARVLATEPADTTALRVQAAELRQELTDLATAHGARQITLSQMVTASQGLTASLEDLEARIAEASRSNVFGGLTEFSYASDDAYGQALERWESLTLAQQREAIRGTWGRIVLRPVKANQRVSLVETVRLVPTSILAQLPGLRDGVVWTQGEDATDRLGVRAVR